MKKKTFVFICLFLAITTVTFVKSTQTNSHDYFLMDEVEAIASGESSEGCSNYLASYKIEQASGGGTVITNTYKCTGLGVGSCFEGDLITYYTSNGTELGSEVQGYRVYCI